jgi:cellulose biosynthesis protein BcsQ
VQRHFNPNLEIGGILLTMVDKRMNYTREIISLIENAYGNDIRIFDGRIPRSVRAAETSAEGKSISVAKHHPLRSAGCAATWTVRTDAQGIPAGTQTRAVCGAAAH